MRFDLQPWDRNRPRRNPPVADAVVSRGDKTFGVRAQNGILFFRQAGDDGKTWAIGSPLPPEVEGKVAAYEVFWRENYEGGNVARVVVPLVYLQIWNERQIPLFLKADRTGFARESWNRDDIPFSHDVSMHFYLEGSDEVLIGEVGSIHSQLADELEQRDFPPDTPDSEEVEWACGSEEELQQLVGWICALETALWEDAEVRAVEVVVDTENAFARAHVSRINFFPNEGRGERKACFGVQEQNDQMQVLFDPIENDTPFRPSGRFFDLMDLALDANTPIGLFWQYTDQGAGRCADAPYAPSLSFEIVRPSEEQGASANDALRRALGGFVPTDELERILRDDAPRQLPRHEW